MAKLHTEDASNVRKHGLAKAIVLFAGIGAAVVLALLLGMAFFGSPTQSAMALQILVVLGIGIAGYGVLAAAVKFIGGLFGNSAVTD